MWEELRRWAFACWPHVLVAALILVCFVSILIAGCLEKHHIHDFERTGSEALHSTSAYFSAMNDAAAQLGFEMDGVFAQRRDSRTYRSCMALWLSRDRGTLLVVGGGKIAGMNYRRTFLLSRLSEDKSLVTVDEFGSDDLSGVWDVQGLINADLPELNTLHAQRLTSSGIAPMHFSSANLLQQYDDLNRARVAKLVRLGLGKYLDPACDVWCYTPKGAWIYAFRGYFGGLNRARGQSDRLKKKRPGS